MRRAASSGTQASAGWCAAAARRVCVDARLVLALRRSDPDVARTLNSTALKTVAVQPNVAKSANNADVPVELVQDIFTGTVRDRRLRHPGCSTHGHALLHVRQAGRIHALAAVHSSTGPGSRA